MAKPHNFREIRKQIIRNNEFITFKNKTILFQNWIKSGLIYINDIIDDQGKISENYIINKLIKKSNWISEINILKKAMPNEWIDALQSDSSIHTVVNI